MAVRKLKDPATAVNDMIAGIQASTGKYADGRLNPRRDPKAAALAANDFYKANVTKSLQEDRWAKRVSKANFDTTPEQAQKDAGKLVAGVEDRKAKILDRTTKYYGLLSPHVDAMDRIVVKSDADADQKMLKNVAGMREIGKKMKEL